MAIHENSPLPTCSTSPSTIIQWHRDDTCCLRLKLRLPLTVPLRHYIKRTSQGGRATLHQIAGTLFCSFRGSHRERRRLSPLRWTAPALQDPTEVGIEGHDENLLRRLAPASAPVPGRHADLLPVGGPVARTVVASRIHERLAEHRSARVPLLPLIGKPTHRHRKGLGGEIVDPDPGRIMNRLFETARYSRRSRSASLHPTHASRAGSVFAAASKSRQPRRRPSRSRMN